MRHFRDKLIGNIKAGDLSTANVAKWNRKPARRGRGAGTTAPRGAFRLGEIRTARSKIISASCRPPGTVPRAIRQSIGSRSLDEYPGQKVNPANPAYPAVSIPVLHVRPMSWTGTGRN